MSRVIVIAEIGENHLGDMHIARKLIKHAAEAGADYVKFQSYLPGTFKAGDPEYEWFRKVSLSDNDHFMLKEYAENCGIKFLSSPFNIERARFLSKRLRLKEIKIASGMMLNFPLLDYINEHANTVFLSTGLSAVKEIKKALTHLKNVRNIYLLHCVSQYPCKDKEANLMSVSFMKQAFPKHKIGYSDHTIGYEACLAAVALGAEVLEKHLTLYKNTKEGTDHILSVEPDELTSMIKSIRRIQEQLGKNRKRPTAGELKIRKFIRSRFR